MRWASNHGGGTVRGSRNRSIRLKHEPNGSRTVPKIGYNAEKRALT